MFLFLIIFLFIYSVINFYSAKRADAIFHFPGGVRTTLNIVVALLILAPILLRVAENMHLEGLVRVTAFIGYLWMAFIFFFFLFNIFLELLSVLFKSRQPSLSALFSSRMMFGLAALLSLALVIYGYIDARQVRIKNLEITTEKILPGDGKLRIMQISDVHVGIIIQRERLAPIVEKIKQAKPDILVCTGDLLDGELDNIMKDAVPFDSIKPRYGKYAILGNHEYYAGLKRSEQFIRAAGFDLLRDEIRQVAGINIFGTDDITGYKMGLIKKNEKFAQALQEKHQDFSLLLQHQPSVDDKSNFDLQLSGHTHGGQIFPFTLIVRQIFPKVYGLYQPAPNKILYVSRGTGTWGPPVRVLASPEITVIDITGKSANR